MMIEKFGHILTDENPGSKWEKNPEDSILFPEHISTVADLLSDQHYDVFIRYGYASSIVFGENDEERKFWKKIYESMQNKRVGKVKIEEFNSLIKSFEKEGYRAGESIPVDENYELLDGSHRLACAALFEEKPRVIIYSQSSHSYKKEWFEENGFSREEIDKIDEIRKFLLKKYQKEVAGSRVAIIWGMALEYWDQILSSVDNKLIRRAFIRDYGNKIEDFIKMSYAGDGMPLQRINEKAKKLSEISSKSGIILLDLNNNEAITFKNKVREETRHKIENYFFDCIIHTIDDQDQGELFFNKYDIKNI